MSENLWACGYNHPLKEEVLRSDGQIMCLFCCNKDRPCDDPDHHYRDECPHCHGTGGLGLPKEDMSETKHTAKEFFQACCLALEHYGDLRAKELLEEWRATDVEEWLSEMLAKLNEGRFHLKCDDGQCGPISEALAMARAQEYQRVKSAWDNLPLEAGFRATIEKMLWERLEKP